MGWLLLTSDSGAVMKANGEEEAALARALHASDAGGGQAGIVRRDCGCGWLPSRVLTLMGAVESFAAPRRGKVLYMFGECSP